VTLPPCFTHTSILLFFAASCGEMPSFDYMHFKEKDRWKLCRHPERNDEIDR